MLQSVCPPSIPVYCADQLWLTRRAKGNVVFCIVTQSFVRRAELYNNAGRCFVKTESSAVASIGSPGAAGGDGLCGQASVSESPFRPLFVAANDFVLAPAHPEAQRRIASIGRALHLEVFKFLV